MKILIINNHTSHIVSILECLKGHNVVVKDFSNITLDDTKDVDAIILTGGSNVRGVVNHSEDYKKEIEIIKNSNKPILGICLGFQLICKVYDAKFVTLPEKIKGFKMLEMTTKDKILEGLTDLKVYDNHKIIVKEVVNLKVIAVSENGIELVKHRKKLIYGVQFHPESYREDTNSSIIFENFIKIIERK